MLFFQMIIEVPYQYILTKLLLSDMETLVSTIQSNVTGKTCYSKHTRVSIYTAQSRYGLSLAALCPHGIHFKYLPRGTRRNNNVIMTPKRRRVITTLFLRRVSAGLTQWGWDKTATGHVQWYWPLVIDPALAESTNFDSCRQATDVSLYDVGLPCIRIPLHL